MYGAKVKNEMKSMTNKLCVKTQRSNKASHLRSLTCIYVRVDVRVHTYTHSKITAPKIQFCTCLRNCHFIHKQSLCFVLVYPSKLYTYNVAYMHGTHFSAAPLPKYYAIFRIHIFIGHYVVIVVCAVIAVLVYTCCRFKCIRAAIHKSRLFKSKCSTHSE